MASNVKRSRPSSSKPQGTQKKTSVKDSRTRSTAAKGKSSAPRKASAENAASAKVEGKPVEILPGQVKPSAEREQVVASEGNTLTSPLLESVTTRNNLPKAEGGIEADVLADIVHRQEATLDRAPVHEAVGHGEGSFSDGALPQAYGTEERERAIIENEEEYARRTGADPSAAKKVALANIEALKAS